MSKRVLYAASVGFGAVVLQTAASVLAAQQGADQLSRVILWPNALSQRLLPCTPLGATMCAGTRLYSAAVIVAWIASVILYSAVAYGAMRLRSDDDI